MKTLKYRVSILCSIVLIALNSCSLDEKIQDAPTPATLTSDADVTAVIQGMYSRFNDPGMFKFLGHNMLTLLADDIYSTSGSEYGPYAQRTFTSANTSPMWNNMYYTISNANSLINMLDRMKLTDAFKRRAYGEAYFIRAFSYYYLVRLYGGVPLRTTPTTIDSDFYLQRNSVDEVYTQIFKDFKAASERLPVKSAVAAADLGRATKGSAQAILAQAYLTYANKQELNGQSGAANFQNSVLYADSVVNSAQYSLLADYGDLFDIAKEAGAYNEVIFGVRFQTDGTARAQPAAGSEYATRFGSSNTWGVSANGANGDNTFRVSHWFADYYRKGDYGNGLSNFTPNIDYRNEKAFFQRGYNPNTVNTDKTLGRFFAVYPNIPGTTIPGAATDGTINDPFIAKYQDPGGKDGRNNGNDFFIIRLAEVYLIKAEAANELNGPTTEALTAFNMVRTRARTVNSLPNARLFPANLTTLTAGTKNDFRLKIFDERGLELVGEGQRWFDLVRMRSPLNPTQTMYEYQFKVVLSDATKFPRTLPTYNATTKRYSNANAIYAPILNVTVPKFLLFPIPATELLQNKKFGSQNPGW
ncbi:MAG TPA: RagB/SusD family nutrient uptake outer membrane protein [Sphingobacteriaceae bacterium]|nr:RagB/SusD family nutrient uptake outer membrane protein [Sphingobacteriaceae bacterium]